MTKFCPVCEILSPIDIADLPIVRLQSEGGEVSFFEGLKDKFDHLRDSECSGEFANESNAYYKSPWLFQVRVQNLYPCTKYFYKVGIKSSMDRFGSEVFQFITPSQVGGTCRKKSGLGEETRIAVIGDIGQTAFSRNTRDYIMYLNKKYNYPCVVLLGDIAYADGDLNRWDSWGRIFQEMTATLPLMTLPGNHEMEISALGESFLPYRKRFFMPEVASEITGLSENVTCHKVEKYIVSMRYDFGSSYYSFDIGKVHFVMLNTYNTYTYKSGEENLQESWVKSDLASVDRKVTPFIVVCAHGPIVSSSKNHQGEYATLKTATWLFPLLEAFQVELFLSGHVHAYERTYALKRTTFVTLGDAGNHEGLYHNWTESSFSAHHDGRFYGHGEVIVYNSSHMKWQFIPNPVQGNPQADEVMIIANAWQDQGQSGSDFFSLVILIPLIFIVGLLFNYYRTSNVDSRGAEVDELLPKNV